MPWDWGTNKKLRTNEIIDLGGWEAMTLAHAWHEENGDGSPQRKSAYKLPHHQIVDGQLKVVFKGVTSAMNVLASTRFGGDIEVKLPRSEVRAAYRHLAEHYRQFGQRPPNILKGWSPKQGWPPRPSAGGTP